MKKVHSDEETEICCVPENTPIDCCQPAGSSCCNPANGKKWNKGKSFISAIIILAAIGVGANSIIKENSAQAAPPSSFSSFFGGKSGKTDGDKKEGAQFSFNRVMDSLQTIDAVAADKDVVFIALPAKGQDLPPTTAKQMEAMLGKLPPSRQKVGAFTLNTRAADYDLLVRRLEIKSFPCFVVLGRQGAPSVISADGLSEAQLFKAYLTASTGGAGCCPVTTKTTCCPN